MKGTKIRFPEDLLHEIDSMVEKRKYSIEEIKGVTKYDRIYTRSDFVREACEEKLLIANKKGDELVERFIYSFQKLMDEESFQKLMFRLIFSAFNKAMNDPNFDQLALMKMFDSFNSETMLELLKKLSSEIKIEPKIEEIDVKQEPETSSVRE